MVKLKVVQTDRDILEETVLTAIRKENERLAEENRKKEQVDKILNKKRIEQQALSSAHDNTCPTCGKDVMELGNGIGKCKSCGTTTMKKGTKVEYVCDNCGGVVPSSFIGTDKNCPHCGGTHVHEVK